VVTGNVGGDLALDLYAVRRAVFGGAGQKLIVTFLLLEGVTDIVWRSCAECAANVKAVRRPNRDYLGRPAGATTSRLLVVMDPPALAQAEVTSLSGWLERVVIRYVSCDPARLARDITLLAAVMARGSALVRSLPRTFTSKRVVLLTR